LALHSGAALWALVGTIKIKILDIGKTDYIFLKVIKFYITNKKNN